VLSHGHGVSTRRQSLAIPAPRGKGEPCFPSVPTDPSCNASDFGAPFGFAGGEWRFSPCRALWWGEEQALVVADLHLEKASWYAQRGQFLPPYDSRETLERLSAAQAATGARCIYALGDSFHDSAGPMRLESGAADVLDALARRAEIVWITGNHDEGLADSPCPAPWPRN
jgi:hypothetical protein